MDFLRGFRFSQVSTLPSAASSTGVVLEYDGKLWYSDGVAWIDISATNDRVRGSVRLSVGTSPHASPSVGDLWVDTN